MYLNYLIIALIGLLFGLLLALSYFSQNMGGEYYNNVHYRQPRRRGMGPILFIFALVAFALTMFGKYNARSDTANNDIREERWTDSIQKAENYANTKNENEQEKEETILMDDLQEQTQMVDNNTQKAPMVHYADVLGQQGQGLLEEGLNRNVKISRTKSEKVLMQNQFRIQLIAGPNKEGALKDARELSKKMSLTVYVMIDQNAPSLAYKVMMGDFSSNKAAKQYIRQHKIPGITKEMNANQYELIAKY